MLPGELSLDYTSLEQGDAMRTSKLLSWIFIATFFLSLSSCNANADKNAETVVKSFFEAIDSNQPVDSLLNIEHFGEWSEDYYAFLLDLLRDGTILNLQTSEISKNDYVHPNNYEVDYLNYDSIASFINFSSNQHRLKYGLVDTIRIAESQINKANDLAMKLFTGFEGDQVFFIIPVVVNSVNSFTSEPLLFVFWVQNKNIIAINQIDLAVASFLKATLN